MGNSRLGTSYASSHVFVIIQEDEMAMGITTIIIVIIIIKDTVDALYNMGNDYIILK